MSATLGTELVSQVADFLGRPKANGVVTGNTAAASAAVPVIMSEGQSYEVEKVYLGSPPGKSRMHGRSWSSVVLVYAVSE